MSKCKKCGATVTWVQKQSDGSWQCYNAGTMTAHWDLCSERRFAAIKKTGEFFDHGETKGYRTDLKKSGVQYTQQSSGLIRSKHKIVPCNECVPAWEECPFECANALPKQEMINAQY